MSGIHYEVEEQEMITDSQFRENMKKLREKLKEKTKNEKN